MVVVLLASRSCPCGRGHRSGRIAECTLACSVHGRNLKHVGRSVAQEWNIRVRPTKLKIYGRPRGAGIYAVANRIRQMLGSTGARGSSPRKNGLSIAGNGG